MTEPIQTRAPSADGAVQIVILYAIAVLFLIVGTILVFTASGLQIGVLLFGSALFTAGTVALTGALVLHAIRG